jgi:hypothetical protein
MPITPETRKAIFGRLSASLKKLSPPMVCSKDTAKCVELIGNTPVPYGSTKKIIPGMYFASVVARKDVVSFYFMPIYYHEKDFADIAPGLMKRLKGKTCFQFTTLEQIDEKEVSVMLKRGTQAWRKLGYVK